MLEHGISDIYEVAAVNSITFSLGILRLIGLKGLYVGFIQLDLSCLRNT
jgi:hypothetical protein